MRMTRCGVILSLLLAACCSVEVMNGGAGRCVVSLRSTALTRQGTVAFAAAARPAASASPSCRRPSPDLRAPVAGSKSLPPATRLPSTVVRRAPNSRSRPASVASTSQYLATRKACRSSSFSTTSRTATLCTRPADSLVRTFFQSTGDSE
jgi:hypothetical protein